MSANLLYITAGSNDEAQMLARALIEERLAACANIIGGMRSLYWWDGKVQDEAETVLILKTRRELVGRAVERVKALHSYDCPCVVALPIEDGNPAFLDWIAAEASGEGGR